ncbi:hypothetical protein LLE87_32675, partial [Paenibacillus polymyxa]|nr:hypothetical protein [Paenibacillus polymyxa]
KGSNNFLQDLMGLRTPWAFPGGQAVKNPPCNAGDTSSISGLGYTPTCCGAAKPTHRNYWAHVEQLLKPARSIATLHNKRHHHNEKPADHN